MGIGPIPWTEMLRWCQWHELTRDSTTHAIAVLRLVDFETLRRERAKMKR